MTFFLYLVKLIRVLKLKKGLRRRRPQRFTFWKISKRAPATTEYPLFFSLIVLPTAPMGMFMRLDHFPLCKVALIPCRIACKAGP